MPNIAAVLKEETSRLARKEVRRETAALQKASAQYRRDIAALKRHVTVLQRQVALLERKVLAGVPVSRLYPGRDELADLLLVAATELTTEDDMQALMDGLKEVL